MKGSIIFHFKEFVDNMTKTIMSPSEAVISLNTSISDIRNKSLTCDINNTDVEKPIARLLFLSDIPEYGIRIRGLSRNNVLYQYSNDLDQWTVEYQYSVNDSLDLTCVWHRGLQLSSYRSLYPNPFQWESKDETFNSAATTNIEFSDKIFTMILNATHNGSKIKCSYPLKDILIRKKTVEIILRLKPELVPEAKRGEDTSGESSTNSYTLVYCLTAAGVSVIIILMISYWTVKKSCCCIRSSSQELPPVPTARPHPDTGFYENLLSVFRTINEREAAELENHYEEVE